MDNIKTMHILYCLQELPHDFSNKRKISLGFILELTFKINDRLKHVCHQLVFVVVAAVVFDLMLLITLDLRTKSKNRFHQMRLINPV